MLKRIFMLFSFALPLLGFAKSYHYPEITTEIRFEPDGTAHIRQERTYAFDGSFSWAFVDLKKQGAKDILFNLVAEKTPEGYKPLRDVQVTNNPSSVYVRWGYHAEDETKTFLLDYTVMGAVTRYPDVAEFYWKLIEDTHEKIDRVRMKIFLPGPSPNLFKIYVHSRAAPGSLEFNDPKDQATVLQDNIPQDAFVELDLLTMPEIFPAARFNPVPHYQTILTAEKKNFLASTVRKFVILPLGLVLMILVPLVLVLVFYFRWGREPKVDYAAEYEHEPPRPAPPLTVAGILEQKPNSTKEYQLVSRAMFATLLDLATKGIVSVEETGKHYGFNLEKPDEVEKLDFFSREVIKFFFDPFSDVDKLAGAKISFTEKELKDYVRAHPTTTRTTLRQLFDYAHDWWEKEIKCTLLAPDSVHAYRLFFWISVPIMIVGYLLFARGLGTFFGLTHIGFTFGAVVAVVCFIIFSLAAKPILRWSEPCYLEHKRWLAFRKFLLDFSAIKQAPIQLLAIWEQYYVYATALGVAREFLKNVTQLAQDRHLSITPPVWFAGAGVASAGFESMSAGMDHFQSFADNFTSTMQSFSTSTSSGGGFSGGGGGGGGGGSSGAG